MSSPLLHVLGTSSQVPTRHRNHNGYFLSWGTEGFLFDPGEGIQRQMIFSQISASRITHIMITHFHGDHCLGLAGLIQRLSLDRVSHTVHVWFPASGQEYFDRLRNASIFYDTTRLEVHPISEAGQIYADKNFTISAEELEHGVDTFGYRISERDSRTMLPERLAHFGIKGPDIGKLKRDGRLEFEGQIIEMDQVSILKPGRSMAFVMDTRPCAGASDLARGVDLLVCESTFLKSETDIAHDFYHMTATQAAELASQANAGKLILTHFSQRYPDTDVFLEEARPIHASVEAARDGDHFEFPRR